MARARQKPSTPPAYANVPLADGPTQQQQARSVYRRAQGLPGVDRATVHELESRLRELEYLGAISARQREAGELFEADYWTVFPSTSPRDSLNLVRGDGHESEAQAERVKRASSRIRKVKQAAGLWYPALRDMCVFRQRVKLAAVVLPPMLDAAADIYGLPGA